MGPCLGTISRIIRKNKFTKVISLLDNIIPHEKRIGDISLSKYFAKSVQGFVAMSKSVLSDLDKFDILKPRELTPHPLFDNFGDAIGKFAAKENLQLNASKKYMLFFGIIRDYKGLDLLLEAMNERELRDLDANLIIAGEFYVDKKKYSDLIDKYNLKNRIELHDRFIPNSEVANYFCASDIIVQPYKSATQSGVTQIGFHFEKPMLVTKVGGLDEIIPHNIAGYAVDPNPLQIAKAINDFYTNSRESTFIENTIKEKEKYSWSKMTKTMIQLTEKI